MSVTILISHALKEDSAEMASIVAANYDTAAAQLFKIDFADMFSNASIKPPFYVAEDAAEKILGFYALWSDTKDFGMQNLLWLNVMPEH